MKFSITHTPLDTLTEDEDEEVSPDDESDFIRLLGEDINNRGSRRTNQTQGDGEVVTKHK
jgi:hypothetical protein